MRGSPYKNLIIHGTANLILMTLPPPALNLNLTKPHPRTVGWFGTTAVAMGGINQSLFLISALFIGQGEISGQGSAAVVLLGIGLLLSWAATPGWVELILMYPNRVGGIAATCAEAFRPYSPVLANLTGVCYWWGWVPTCGLAALLASSAIVHWYLPEWSVPMLASGIILLVTIVNLCGVKWVMRLSMPIATLASALAFLSALIPVFSSNVAWEQAFNFTLTVPFEGWFGKVTSIMAGLYLIGFAAPAFEQAACHVGETINPNKNVPRAMFLSAGLASLYFIVLPIIWLGTLGPESMAKELAMELGPTFAPLLAGSAKAAAIWFMIFNMLHGTIAPLAGASRTLSQLAEDGLLPESLGKRNVYDAPWVATLLTAAMAIAFLLIGDPLWLIAAANLTYLIGIALPSVAVWLLRRNEPDLPRPYRAPRGTIQLGLLAAAIWGLTVVLGFQQFGLPTVFIGIMFACSGSILYAWRKFFDRRKAGLPGVGHTLHLKLTGAMLLVLILDAAGYLLAVNEVPLNRVALISALEDIFVVVALLTFSVGLILPGMIANSAVEVSKATNKLINGTLADFISAMRALAAGDLDNAKAKFDLAPLRVFTNDEVGDMALSFNALQVKMGSAALALDDARESMIKSHKVMTDRNNQLRIAATIFESQEGMLVTDASNIILRVNPAFTSITSYTAEDAIGQNPQMLNSGQHDKAFFIAMWESIAITGKWTGEIWNRHKNGKAYLQHLIITAVKDLNGIVTNYVATFTDITERKLAADEITNLAYYDPLTQLPNRRLLLSRLYAALALSERTGKDGALLFLDLDHFKMLNDTLGHDIGDLLLQQVATRLIDAVREIDTVARLGGDEYVVMLENLSEHPIEAAAQAEIVCEKIMSSLNQPYHLTMHEYSCSASIGVVLLKGHNQSQEDILKHADIAMYQAKKAGRNTIRFFNPEMQEAINARVAMERELRIALVQQQFQLYYQVQVDSFYRPIGAEVLIRWLHPVRGLVPPLQFIPLAEETGLILPIGQWVLETACAQLKTWQQHASTHNYTLSVNVSAKQFFQTDFVAQVKAVVQRYAINPMQLKLELTESLLVGNIEETILTMNAFKEMGIRFSLDDFGTGYSSLQYLKRLPLYQLKIDQSFVRDIPTDNSDKAIVRTIIAMAKSMDLDVIAEGVESDEQLSFLISYGCEHFQGYFFGKPVPIELFDVAATKIRLNLASGTGTPRLKL